MSATAHATPRFDVQGDQSDEARVDAAMRSFVREIGVTSALHLESCVRCGLCADACHFYLTTGDPKYTPVRKLEPLRRAYLREVSPWAPVVRALGLVRKLGIDELQQWQELLYDSCTMCGRCTPCARWASTSRSWSRSRATACSRPAWCRSGWH